MAALDGVAIRLAAMTDITPGQGPNGECHEFTGTKPTGYGAISVGITMKLAHRVAWELEHGEIADGLMVLHSCDNPACVRVGHLFLGTQADNMSDMVLKGRAVGTSRPGVSNSQAKLTDEAVAEIRVSPLTGVEMAQKHGVSQSTVSMIRAGKRWRR